MRRQRQTNSLLTLETLEDRLTPAFNFQGGAIISHPQVVAVYYGDYWSTSTGMQSAAQINTFLSYVVNSSFMDQLNQYGVGRGTTLGVGVIDSGLAGGNAITDADIQAKLSGDFTSGRLPGVASNTLYLVFTPPDVSVSSSVLNNAFDQFGYHSALSYGTNGGIADYAVIINPVGNGTYGSLTNFQTITHTITLELANAVTDPTGNGWIDRSTGYEVGSLVNQSGNYAFFNNYVVAGLWSAVAQSASYPPGSTPPTYSPPADQIITANVLAPVASSFAHAFEYYDGLVQDYYETYLGRSGGQDELNYWALVLSTGSRDEVVLSHILGSDEYFRKSGGTNEDWLNHLYADLLNRTPEESGEAVWLNSLAAGATRQQVASLIDMSAERDAIVIGSFYQNYLGRSGASPEVSYWVGALQTGATQEQVISSILGSPEYLTHVGGTLSGWLTSVFEVFLGRTPDPAGFNAWIRVLQTPFAN